MGTHRMARVCSIKTRRDKKTVAARLLRIVETLQIRTLMEIKPDWEEEEEDECWDEYYLLDGCNCDD